jgi:hypothetical protein
VDVTWDDPVYTGRQPDKEFIAHDYFLLSDDALHAKSHHDWNLRGLPPAINTQHEGRIWPRVSGRGQTG